MALRVVAGMSGSRSGACGTARASGRPGRAGAVRPVRDKGAPACMKRVRQVYSGRDPAGPGGGVRRMV
ncbi:hypothetical protein TNCT1_06000 [Streptomyces sp. 1-11]|nr:hypothetical protein TNCT1_06000 [Streptomyces sp. 1-11]